MDGQMNGQRTSFTPKNLETYTKCLLHCFGSLIKGLRTSSVLLSLKTDYYTKTDKPINPNFSNNPVFIGKTPYTKKLYICLFVADQTEDFQNRLLPYRTILEKIASSRALRSRFLR